LINNITQQIAFIWCVVTEIGADVVSNCKKTINYILLFLKKKHDKENISDSDCIEGNQTKDLEKNTGSLRLIVVGFSYGYSDNNGMDKFSFTSIY